MLELKCCPKCGKKNFRKVPTKSSWEEKKDCVSCNLRYHIIRGDYMGGSSDSMEVYPIPKDKEGNVLA